MNTKTKKRVKESINHDMGVAAVKSYQAMKVVHAMATRELAAVNDDHRQRDTARARRLKAVIREPVAEVMDDPAADSKVIGLFNTLARVPEYTDARARALVCVSLAPIFAGGVHLTQRADVATDAIVGAVRHHVSLFSDARNQRPTWVYQAITNRRQCRQRQRWAAAVSVIAGSIGETAALTGWKNFTSTRPVLVDDLTAAANQLDVAREMKR